ncbi:helicase [Mono Lake orbivirus]|nr:helicase [Mono Lake orbivirus]
MSSRLILLAPGDVIRTVAAELKQLHVDVALEDAGGEHGDTDPEDKNTSRGDGKSDRRERDSGDDVLVRPIQGSSKPGDSGGDPTEGNPATSNARDANATAPDHQCRSTNVRDGSTGGDASGESDRVASPAKDSGTGGGHLDNVRPSEGNRPLIVASERIATLLRGRGQTSVEVYRTGSTLPPNSMFLWFGSQALKSLGAEASEGAAQKDTESAIRRLRLANGAITIDKIHSAAELDRRFPRREDARPARVAVALVSNRQSDVPRAHMLFTSPTGDTGWKAVAREATRRPNIRAYSHDPQSPEKPGEALLQLIMSS